jgi:polysaccharide export outer membrane protein
MPRSFIALIGCAAACLLAATAGAQSTDAGSSPQPSSTAPAAPGTTSTSGTIGTTGTTGTAQPAAAAPAAAGDVPRTGTVVPPGQQREYRIVPGDKLRVEVYKDPQLSQSLQVRPDGKITLPLLGDIPASGLTPIELRDRIAADLKEYVTNPTVTVIVAETVPPMVYVMGEVNNPGSIGMHGPLTVVQALAMAGGFRDFANTKNIRVLRKTARGVQTIDFNYKRAVKGEADPVPLMPGDTIVVP